MTAEPTAIPLDIPPAAPAVEVDIVREVREIRTAITGAPPFPAVIDGRAFHPDAVDLTFVCHADEPWQTEQCVLRGDLRPIPGAPAGLHTYRGHRHMPVAWHPSWPDWLRQVVEELHPCRR